MCVDGAMAAGLRRALSSPVVAAAQPAATSSSKDSAVSIAVDPVDHMAVAVRRSEDSNSDLLPMKSSSSRSHKKVAAKDVSKTAATICLPALIITVRRLGRYEKVLKIHVVPPKWILDSLSNYSLQSATTYTFASF